MTRKSKLLILAIFALIGGGAAYFGAGMTNSEGQVEASDAIEASDDYTRLAMEADDRQTLLTLSGGPDGTEITLTERALMAMPHVYIKTKNEFVDDVTTFSGPLARDVMALLDVDGSSVVLTAVNDYSVEVPLEDFVKYDVVFAMAADGERFSRRDKGPLWVIYPMSDFPELQDPVYNARLIWQLVKVELK